jgi:hypothetical protein
MRSGPVVATLLAAMALLAGCGAAASAEPATAKPAIVQPANTIKVTSSKVTGSQSCQQQGPGGGSIDLFPIGQTGNGRTFSMFTCQAVEIELAHPATGTDGCHWTQLQSSDDLVVKVLPIPITSPPLGGVNEAWIAAGPGSASITSSLACPGGATQEWGATFVVTDS